MSKIVLALVLVLIVVSFSPSLVRAQQGGDVHLHGGGAETLVNDCVAVDRMDPQTHQGPAKDAQSIQYCFGYVLGFVDTYAILSPSLRFTGNICIPDNVSVTQLAKVVAKYGADHPEELNQPAMVVVSEAFVHSFPCK
jgi:hypothetical protein